MKHFLILFIISFTSTKVYSIVPKYISYSELSKQGSIDDTNLINSRKYQANKIPEVDNFFRDENKFADTFTNIESHRRVPLKKPLKKIDASLEINNSHNRLPEVNLKLSVNSAEFVNDESVEDFVDFSIEEPSSAETEDNKNKNIYSVKKENFADVALTPKFAKELNFQENGLVSLYDNIAKINNKRAKRVATDIYEGRYKSQDINDVREAIVINSPQTKEQVHKNVKETETDLTKSRLKRSTNVIEEENIVTTISIFKFTGRPTLLNQDLAFKNIHA